MNKTHPIFPFQPQDQLCLGENIVILGLAQCGKTTLMNELWKQKLSLLCCKTVWQNGPSAFPQAEYPSGVCVVPWSTPLSSLIPSSHGHALILDEADERFREISSVDLNRDDLSISLIASPYFRWNELQTPNLFHWYFIGHGSEPWLQTIFDCLTRGLNDPSSMSFDEFRKIHQELTAMTYPSRSHHGFLVVSIQNGFLKLFSYRTPDPHWERKKRELMNGIEEWWIHQSLQQQGEIIQRLRRFLDGDEKEEIIHSFNTMIRQLVNGSQENEKEININ